MAARDEPHRDRRLRDDRERERWLREAVAQACASAGVPHMVAPAEYCLAVLSRKDDPARDHTYGLDPGAPDVRDRLAHWAEVIVRNLRQWGGAYEQIRLEADAYTTTTIRRLVRISRPEDVVAVVADELSDVLVAGPSIEEMSLERARRREPGGNDYVFQSPLPRWLATSVRRRLPRDMDDIANHEHELTQRGTTGDSSEEIAAMNEQSDEIFAALVAWVRTLAKWQVDVAEALHIAGEAEQTLAGAPLAREHDRALVAQLRASLLRTIEDLGAERRSIPDLGAYLMLAMRASAVRQRVALLSLRMGRIAPAAVATIDSALREALANERQPTPELLRRTREAPARPVPRTRVDALEAVRDAGARRPVMLAPMARLLDELPPVVADLDAVAAEAKVSMTAATTHRSAGLKELDAVHWAIGRLFRRYAMGMA